MHHFLSPMPSEAQVPDGGIAFGGSWGFLGAWIFSGFLGSGYSHSFLDARPLGELLSLALGERKCPLKESHQLTNSLSGLVGSLYGQALERHPSRRLDRRHQAHQRHAPCASASPNRRHSHTDRHTSCGPIKPAPSCSHT